MQSRRRLSFLVVVGALALATPAAAQTAGGLGKAIADASVPKGTIIVRVVNGSLSKPVSSLEIGLVDESSGKELVVRTGPQGRAEFHNLAIGASLTAFAKVGDKEMSSDRMIVPSGGGLRVLLSPIPISAVAGAEPEAGGPHAGGAGNAGGMPDPRQMSGMARPEQNDAAGKLTVRTIQGKFRIDPIAGRISDPALGATVYLVGFTKKGEVTVKSAVVDDEGRVEFTRLAKDNSTSYWVLSSFERNGSYDRLQSSSIELLPQVGLRLMLAGLARDSTEAPVDDLPIFRQKKDTVLPGPGIVSVELAGQAQQVATIELVDASTGKAIGTATPTLDQPVSAVTGSIAAPVPDPALRDGLVQVRVAGPSGPLPGAVVRVFAYPIEPSAPALAEATADANGLANIDAVKPGTAVVVSITAQGKEERTPPIKTSIKGGDRIIASYRWQQLQPSLRARFEGLPSGTDKIYYARAKTSAGKPYFSPPFQMLPDRGAVAGVLVYPDLLVGFQGGAELDDNRVWFQLRFSIANPSLVPLDTGKAGLLIPLPPGFVGASVADEMASRVTVDKDHGFIWKGAFPPGQRDFMGQFALPIDSGGIDFAMPLPYGVFNSHLIFEDIPGMELNVPSNAKRETREGPGGRRFIMLRQINVKAGQTLRFTVRGLPEAPRWKRVSRNLSGLVVLVVLSLGFVSILLARGRSAAAVSVGSLESRREQLLARVVALDERRAKNKNKKSKGARRDDDEQRAKLLAELEEIYTELGETP